MLLKLFLIITSVSLPGAFPASSLSLSPSAHLCNNGHFLSASEAGGLFCCGNSGAKFDVMSGSFVDDYDAATQSHIWCYVMDQFFRPTRALTRGSVQNLHLSKVIRGPALITHFDVAGQPWDLSFIEHDVLSIAATGSTATASIASSTKSPSPVLSHEAILDLSNALHPTTHHTFPIYVLATDIQDSHIGYVLSTTRRLLRGLPTSHGALAPPKAPPQVPPGYEAVFMELWDISNVPPGIVPPAGFSFDVATCWIYAVLPEAPRAAGAPHPQLMWATYSVSTSDDDGGRIIVHGVGDPSSLLWDSSTGLLVGRFVGQAVGAATWTLYPMWSSLLSYIEFDYRIGLVSHIVTPSTSSASVQALIFAGAPNRIQVDPSLTTIVFTLTFSSADAGQPHRSGILANNPWDDTFVPTIIAPATTLKVEFICLISRAPNAAGVVTPTLLGGMWAGGQRISAASTRTLPRDVAVLYKGGTVIVLLACGAARGWTGPNPAAATFAPTRPDSLCVVVDDMPYELVVTQGEVDTFAVHRVGDTVGYMLDASPVGFTMTIPGRAAPLDCAAMQTCYVWFSTDLPTATLSSTATPTPTPSPSRTPSATLSATSSRSPSYTITPSSQASATVSASRTPSSSQSHAPAWTPTLVTTRLPSHSATRTATALRHTTTPPPPPPSRTRPHTAIPTPARTRSVPSSHTRTRAAAPSPTTPSLLPRPATPSAAHPTTSVTRPPHPTTAATATPVAPSATAPQGPSPLPVPPVAPPGAPLLSPTPRHPSATPQTPLLFVQRGTYNETMMILLVATVVVVTAALIATVAVLHAWHMNEQMLHSATYLNGGGSTETETDSEDNDYHVPQSSADCHNEIRRWQRDTAMLDGEDGDESFGADFPPTISYPFYSFPRGTQALGL